MKKNLMVVLMVSLLLFGLLTGCSKSDSMGGQTGESITITDHNDEQVTVPSQIDRIAVCGIYPLPSVISVFFDSAEKIVAMSPTSMSAVKNGLLSQLYPEILKADTSATSGSDVNVEELMKLDPQVVFYDADSPQIAEALKKAGFNAVAVSVNKWGYDPIETLNQWIKLLSQIFPESANHRAELVKKYSEETKTLVAKRIEKLTDEQRKRVFFLFQYSEAAIMTGGEKSFGQWWTDAIGAVNVASGLKDDKSFKVTLEQVYDWNPDIILMSNFTTFFPEDLYGNTVGSYDWSGIKAVQNKKVYKMPLGMYRTYTPGVDTPITLLWMAKTVYPDLFQDIDIKEKTMEYYKDVFGITLTEQQAQSIFEPEGSAGKIDL